MAKRLNEFLKSKRLESGLSQADVSRELGYSSPQFISNWERGLVTPPLNTLAKLVEIYELNRESVVKLLVQDYKVEIEQAFVPKAKSARSAKPKRRSLAN